MHRKPRGDLWDQPIMPSGWKEGTRAEKVSQQDLHNIECTGIQVKVMAKWKAPGPDEGRIKNFVLLKVLIRTSLCCTAFTLNIVLSKTNFAMKDDTKGTESTTTGL